MCSIRHLRSDVVQAACALCFAAPSSFASPQSVVQWASPVNGAWAEPGSWNPADVPDTLDEIAHIGHSSPLTVWVAAGAAHTVYGLAVPNLSAEISIDGPTNSAGTWIRVGGGGVLNDGLIRVLPGSATAAGGLAFVQSCTLSGLGRLRLEEALQAEVFAAAGVSVVHASGHVIEGTGRINAATTGTVINEGRISANVSGQPLSLWRATNRAIIDATNGGVVLIDGVVNQSAEGRIRADGGVVRFENGLVAGGLVEASVGSWVEVATKRTGAVDGVVARGEWRINGSTNATYCRLHIQSGGLRNEGVIRVLSGGAFTDQGLYFSHNSVLSGPGTVVLEEQSDATVTVANGVTATHASDHSIVGRGSIFADGSGVFINMGSIIANANNLRLALSGIDNRSIAVATAGGILRPSQVLQSIDGVLRADGGRIEFAGIARITGGTIEAIAGSVVEVTGGTVVRLNGVTIDGDWRVYPASGGASSVLEVLEDGVINNGVVRILPGTAANPTRLDFGVPAVLGGTGQVRLEGLAGSQIYVGASTLAVNESGHSITGTGQILSESSGRFVNRGLIAPGSPIGSMTFSGVQLSALGTLEIEYAGPAATQRDSVANAADLSLDGTLRVRFRDGFVPEPCDHHVVISGGTVTGRFAIFDAPQMPIGRLSVRYGANSVAVVYLPADYDGSGTVDQVDYEGFVSDFVEGDWAADFDRTGFVDLEDFHSFVEEFERSC
ncbi:MAG: hypothetical protein AMXMBFR58_17860 [Phycisphaerae bacterium]